MNQPDRSAEPVATRAGYVALVGVPNVGKSTLMNALVGEKLSIVTPRPQTTRERVTGILSEEGIQAVFLDTPGLLEPRYLLQRSMLEAARSALAEADIVLLLLDATRPEETLPPADVLDELRSRAGPVIVAVNKVDAARADGVDRLAVWSRSELGREPLRVSAVGGAGIGELRSELRRLLPESPFLYPEEDVAVQPVRFFVAELVRETVFETYAEEIPYSTVVRIEEFREGEDPLFIRATVFVERESQKGIIVGRGGASIRRLGVQARAKIEAFVGRRVYLDLWVKTMPRWRRRASSLKHLGYAVPRE